MEKNDAPAHPLDAALLRAALRVKTETGHRAALASLQSLRDLAAPQPPGVAPRAPVALRRDAAEPLLVRPPAPPSPWSETPDQPDARLDWMFDNSRPRRKRQPQTD